MQHLYQTERLSLTELTFADREFLFELVNTPEWIRFIGDRNIRTLEDASVYIQKIIDNPNSNYWVVRLQDDQSTIGIITFIKRDYLEHYDIGFAFLSPYAKNGYGYEATAAILMDVVKNPIHTHILATTVKDNLNSIKLLEKLGLRFYKEIEVENKLLLLYSAKIGEFFLRDTKF